MNENLTIPEGMDAGAVNAARAIRKQEGGDYENYSGDGGTSAGAYQWNNQPNGKSVPLKKGEIPSNFQSDAKQFGLDPNDFSPKNQDMVAYSKIKSLKDSGNNVVDIAAIWNGGDKNRQDSNYVTPSGLPSQKEEVYDVPAYAKAVNDYYQELKTKTQSGNDTARQTFASSVPNPSPEKQPTVAGNLIRGLINGSGIPSLAASGANLVETLEGKPETDTFHNSYLGDISRVGKDFEPSQGVTSKNIGALADAGAQGIGLATTLESGKGLLNLGKGLVKGTLLKSASVLESPAVQNGIKRVGLNVEKFTAMSAGDQLEALTEATKMANTADKAVLQQAITKIAPQAIQEAGGKVAFSQAHPIIAKALEIGKGLAKQAIAGTIAGNIISKGEKVAGLIK